MPGFDGAGPGGMGPMTGGGRGFCAAPLAGVRPKPFGRRFFGRGRGRGHRNMYYTTGLPGWARAGYGYPVFGMGYAPDISEKQEAEMLKEESELLKEELGTIQERLKAIEKVKETEK